MNDSHVNLYARMADKAERDPYGPDGSGRAVVVNGRGFALYKRFHKGDTISVATLQGKWVEITRHQADVLDLSRQLVNTGPTSMREMAKTLGVSPSTVYRALVKLASYGLIAYITARGWKHGTILLARGANDGLDRFQRAAREKVKRWAEQTRARFARLAAPVATYVLEGGRRGDSLSDYVLVTHGRNTAREWTPDELRWSGIL